MQSNRRTTPGKIKLCLCLAGVIFTFLLQPIAVHASSYMRQGKLSYSYRNYEKAERMFRAAIRQSPQNGEPYFYLGHIREKQGRKDEAVDEYRRAVSRRLSVSLRTASYWKIVLHYRYRQDWENLEIYAGKFLKFRRIGRVEKMLKEARSKSNPRLLHLNRLIRKGRNYLRRARYRDAEIILRKAITQHPRHKPARWDYSEALMGLGLYPEALAQLHWLIRASPQIWHYRYRAGQAAHYAGRYAKALQHYRRTARMKPKPDSRFRFYLNLRKAMVRLDTGNFQRARVLLNRARSQIRGRTKKERALILSLEAIHALGVDQYARTRRLASRAIRLNHREHRATLTLILDNIRQRRDPASALKASTIKKMHRFLKRTSKKYPIKAYRRISRYASLVYLFTGFQYIVENDSALALTALQRVSESELQKTGALRIIGMENQGPELARRRRHGMARILTDKNRADEALQILINASPDDAEAYFLRSRAHARKGSVSEAAASLQLGARGREESTIWQRALADPYIREISWKNPRFRSFLESRGRTPFAAEPNANPGE